MRHTLAPSLIFISLLAISSAHAAGGASDPCTLLDWHDFQFMNVTETSGITSSGWHDETPPAELPGSTLSTGLCAAITKSDKGREAVTLNLSSLKGKVTEQQFEDWLKTVDAASDRENVKDAKEFKLEDAECESGSDVVTIPSQFEGEADMTITEYYVACDKHVNLIHLSVNAQVAQDRKSDLPDARLVKALLDKSVARLKQMSFKTPN